MLASFLCCHSITGDLELDCVGVSTRGGGGDKNTSARLCTKNAGGGAYARGGHICGTLRYIYPMRKIFSAETPNAHTLVCMHTHTHTHTGYTHVIHLQLHSDVFHFLCCPVVLLWMLKPVTHCLLPLYLKIYQKCDQEVKKRFQ